MVFSLALSGCFRLPLVAFAFTRSDIRVNQRRFILRQSNGVIHLTSMLLGLKHSPGSEVLRCYLRPNLCLYDLFLGGESCYSSLLIFLLGSDHRLATSVTPQGLVSQPGQNYFYCVGLYSHSIHLI